MSAAPAERFRIRTGRLRGDEQYRTALPRVDFAIFIGTRWKSTYHQDLPGLRRQAFEAGDSGGNGRWQKNIAELSDMSIREALDFIDSIAFSEKDEI